MLRWGCNTTFARATRSPKHYARRSEPDHEHESLDTKLWQIVFDVVIRGMKPRKDAITIRPPLSNREGRQKIAGAS